MKTRTSLKKRSWGLRKLLSFVTPKGSLFFSLFDEDAANITRMGKALNELIRTTDHDRRTELIHLIADWEHRGDEITHEIFIELGSNFITPFDREDIHELAVTLDDIADYIHGTAARIELYEIKEFSGSMKRMAEIIEQLGNEVEIAVTLLENLKNPAKIREAIVRINSLENHADDVFDEAIARLFSECTDAIQLIKEKEILANMETATDMCEDVANVIETILVKNS